MPLSRKKACARCRQAKLSCDRGLPACSRCVRRKAKCAYVSERPVPCPDATFDSPADTSTLDNSFGWTEDQLLGGVEEEDQMQDWPQMQGQDADAPTFLNLGNAVLEQQQPPYHGQLPGKDQQSIFTLETPAWVFEDTDASQQLSFQNSPQRPSPDLLSTDTPGMQVARPADTRWLKKRRILTDCVLTVAVMGQVTSWPRMLTQGDRLPPFIKPPCHMDEELAPECAVSGKHRCLPRRLAVCAGLVHMFYARTPGNASYVWEMIYTEAARLRKEVHDEDAEGKLQCLQSVVTFLLLQADDPSSVEKNNVHSLLSAGMHILITTATSIQWQCEPLNTRPRQRDWVFRESLRRLIVLYGIIDLLLEGLHAEYNHLCPAAESFNKAILPCSRELWEATSTRVWMKEYDLYLAARDTDAVLFMQHLVDSRLSSGGSGSLAPGITQWSKGMDSLGMLVMMVIPLQRHRLRDDVRDTW